MSAVADTETPPFDLVIEAGRTERHYWADLWRYRELFYFLAWRDILVRYKQAVLGAAWAILRPALTMLVFVVVFGRIARLPSDGAPYPLLVLAAMLPWQFFSGALSEASGSLVGNANLISKVYFPRIVVPASAVIVSLADFIVSLALLAGLLLWYGVNPGLRLLALLPFTALAFAAALGAGLWLTALNVKYRDFRYVIPFIVQFGLFISPVGFSSAVIPEKWRLLYSLNPMVGVIDGFRWAVLGGELRLPGLALSALVTIVLCACGIWYFRKTEKTFADVI